MNFNEKPIENKKYLVISSKDTNHKSLRLYHINVKF